MCTTTTATVEVTQESEEKFVGGAGVVAKHLASAGALVTFPTVPGNDSLRFFVEEDLRASGIKHDLLIDESRPTTSKNAFLVNDQQLLQVDIVDNRSISDVILDDFARVLKETNAKVVVFSDFRHGIFNSRTVPILTHAIPNRCFTAADSQVSSRWGNITDFQGFDLITPNEREARFALGDQDSGIRPLSSKIYDAANCGLLFLKLGSRGVVVCVSSDHEDPLSFFAIDSFADQVVDPVGAGDALLAYATLAINVSTNPTTAAILGVFAASVEVEFAGNVPVKPEYVLNKINEAERL